ncbi:M23 family metallopeptidase [Altericroceibacterium endophyticum]|uniref:Peptidoglycan DD-metalloendopeptidase family protein n=1 Tax=Altericroceibacterium endophyticum TaxID=1808508 RepID=A0A6I4T5D7_9SPHN|nr:M23 family metallopeptidase [Altericroceibacterium endophyticum]MXO65669.1 peptidoglycan DD-metalloendopeptidase family protein [Altericroceibacterium endophyticum]
MIGDGSGEKGAETPNGSITKKRTAQLSHDQIVPGGSTGLTGLAQWRAQYERWRTKVSARLSALDLAPDLARDIGSARWLRGMATLIGLSAVAIAMFPGFSSVEAAPAMRIDGAARDEFRSHMIMPLALGADSGRHMGATAIVTPLARAPERPQIEVMATLAKGDSFSRMLRRAGVSGSEADHLTQLIADQIDLQDLKPGTQVDLTLGRRTTQDAPRPLTEMHFRARFDLEMAAQRQNGRLVITPRTIKVDSTPLRIRGTVGPSLYRSAREAGAPPRAVQQYLRTLGGDVNLDRDVDARDEFDLIVDYKRAETGDVEMGDLLYAALLRDGQPVKQLMRWGDEGKFYQPSGLGEQRDGLMAPVPGRITSRYGMRRHPILGYKRMHRGLDFKASYGTPIYAASDGTVQYAGRHGGHGNYVKIAHGGGLATGYAHMSRIAARRGAHVKRGQIIGYVGSTGLSTGPHLHYEMYRNGTTINPASVNFVTRDRISGRELANFRDRMSRLTKVEAGAALEVLKPAEEAQPEREIDKVNGPRKVG